MAKTARSSGSFVALVLAAGKGTRMRSSRAKVLHEVCGRPLAYFPIARALEAGARKVVVVVGHQAAEARARLGELFGDAVVFADQTEQRGTGHAVLAARSELERVRAAKVMILNGDLPLVTTATLKRLVRAGAKSEVALLSAHLPDATGYGRVVRDAQGEITHIVEHKDATREQRANTEVNVGAYFVERRFLFEVLGGVGDSSATGEVYLTGVVSVAQARGKRVAALVASDVAEVRGVNDRAELAEAALRLRARINGELMRSGVTLEDPATAYVDVGVRIGRDSHLGPGVHLSGETRLGKGVLVGPGCILEDSTVGDGTQLLPYSLLDQAEVGRGARVGPFARLRPGTVLEDGVHIGNFVETKKTHVGRGAKANHLTYLGDAEVGAGSNVGAGTITCNYDGANKHRTVIGEGAFIGSNTALVAPVEVGDGAYVGAGSTVTQDVPDGSLAVSRARQRNLEGWARRHAPKKPKKKS